MPNDPRSSARILLVAFAALAGLSLIGCQYRNTKDTYYLISVNGKLPYWKTVQAGFNDAAQQYGITARIVGPDNYDPAAEASALSDAVAARPAGILISAASASAVQGGINDAIAAGVPVITVDSDAPNSNRLYFIGTNNLEAGHIGGRRLVEKLKGKGRVVVFTIPGQPNLDERLKGYRDILNDNPGIQIVAISNTGGQVNAAFDSARQYLGQTGKDKVDGFVCLESVSGKDVAEAIKRDHATDRVLVAMDIDPDTLQYIKDGTMDSTVAQRPYTMGYFGIKMLDEVHHARHGDFRPNYSTDLRSPYPLFVDTGTALISQQNESIYEKSIGELTTK